MAKKPVQTIQLSAEDRNILKRGVKWVRSFSLMYIGLWVVLCTILFILIWVLFRRGA